MTHEVLIGLIVIAGFFGLMVLRTPVGIAMLVAGFVGTFWLDGLRAAGAVLSTETYASVSNYSLTVVPLFILMGNLASKAGFSRGLYEAAFAWVGWMRGGLASASVLGCAAFSAVSGSSVATAVTIGRVALPEMSRLGYAPALSTGAVAAGGTLGLLIPPSTGFVLYAILTEESIGKLFMAGILPGLLLTALFLLTVAVMSMLDPKAGPRGPKVPMAARMRALGQAMPLVVVIVISIGGIYAGVFTPVEAAGIGAALVLFLALGLRRLSWGLWGEAMAETVTTTAMLYMVVIGANVFAPFLALTDIPHALSAGLNQTGLGPVGTLLIILAAYVVLGMFMDGLSMLVVTVPIVYPVIVGLGFDPIWFGVIAVIVIEMGMITPPVGINVFMVKGIAPDIPMGTIFRGVLPFWGAMIVCLAMLIVWPQIALVIPQSMFR